MTDHGPFDPDATDTKTRIMQATLEALHEYGYAGISMSRIAEYADISKSSLYHHYSGKDALLYDLLDRILTQLEDEFALREFDDPVTALELLLVQGIRGQFPDQPDTGQIIENVAPADADPAQSHDTFVELRAQAVHDDTYRETITGLDDTLGAHIETIIQAGIDQGVFRDVDPRPVAQTLLTLVLGAIVRRATSDTADMAAVHAVTRDCIDRLLLRDDVDFDDPTGSP
jgi:AcrR family transcriptional regulator